MGINAVSQLHAGTVSNILLQTLRSLRITHFPHFYSARLKKLVSQCLFCITLLPYTPQQMSGLGE